MRGTAKPKQNADRNCLLTHEVQYKTLSVNYNKTGFDVLLPWNVKLRSSKCCA